VNFSFDITTERLRDALRDFMDSHVYPGESVFAAQIASSEDPWTIPPVIDELKAEARQRGLWNLFLPGEHRAGLTNLQYAPLAEITGRSPSIAPAGWIAEARVTVEQLRLLVLKTAWLMDHVGNRGAHTEIQAIKIAVPQAVSQIIDHAIQVHGAGGLTQDFPLAELYAQARVLRIADGPDEVHKNSLARAELGKYK
jgi:alkylation response protein AidB-like acyl-CoA dehydrogenase